METVNTHIASVLLAAGAVEIAKDPETIKGCLIALAVYALKGLIVRVWDKVFKKA